MLIETRKRARTAMMASLRVKMTRASARVCTTLYWTSDPRATAKMRLRKTAVLTTR